MTSPPRLPNTHEPVTDLPTARRRLLRWGVIALAAAGAWVALGARVESFATLGLGLVLLWTAAAASDWWRVRRGATRPPVDPVAAAIAERAQQDAAARHGARLLAHPPRLAYLVLGCVAVASATQLGVVDASVEAAGLVKPLARAGEWWRLLTATYLHGGIVHFWFNFAALRTLAPLVEAYAPRARLPLVYLAAGLAGNAASLVLLPNQSTLGASGAILGLVGYLLVLGFRRPDEMPPPLRRGLLSTLGLTAALGIIGFALIDNAGHAGGTAMGALIGALTIPRAGTLERRTPILDALGWLAAAVLVAGAALAVARVLPLHRGLIGR